ncbi:hypothetical protein SODALDRAFT_112257 [Sodiomyces alkalinus F11]|uniref:CCHC-type domain-containing protein n=1 Tax=Sodiomyces alkalinus (strain CBS 110278 / VKM F-3762 / F11) TaxID=1314773 RepID=A0A3N2Q316_SODAK|nr:hypothetical protein SODALDRAFT_112257 [Sodiomyces alkalinus F11]ROT41116.1 hypothetical protein SODALDRAFT_112257 [Sodiomyces alkalinus F11]
MGGENAKCPPPSVTEADQPGSEAGSRQVENLSPPTAAGAMTVPSGSSGDKAPAASVTNGSLSLGRSRKTKAYGVHWTLPVDTMVPLMPSDSKCVENWFRAWCEALVEENPKKKQKLTDVIVNVLMGIHLKHATSPEAKDAKQQHKWRALVKKGFNKLRKLGTVTTILRQCTEAQEGSSAAPLDPTDKTTADTEQPDFDSPDPTVNGDTSTGVPTPSRPPTLAEPDSEPEPEPDLQPALEPQPDPDLEPQSEPELELQPEAEPEPQPSSSEHEAHAPTASPETDDAHDMQIAAAEVPAESWRTVVDEEEALRQQQRYFPGASGLFDICIVCAALGHSALNCQNTLCRHCRGDHFSWSCPQRSRCAKCRQLGHRESICEEKLAMTDDEGLECAFCAAAHHEDVCDEIWRSYHPRSQDVKTVRDIPAFCGYCGAEGHFSSDCGLRGYRPVSLTWSMQNRDLYVDPRSAEEASATSATFAEPGSELRIKGASAKRTHIFYPDSDGSEEGEFIGEKVRTREPPAKMRVSSNIRFTPVNGARPPPPPPPASYAQPPLPPGPPPPGPPGGYSAFAHPLPPRPMPRAPGPNQVAAQPKTSGKGKQGSSSKNDKRAGSSQQQSGNNNRKSRNNRRKPKTK